MNTNNSRKANSEFGSGYMRVRLTKSDYIWSYVGYFFSLFTSVVILPFVMKKVPSDELGLWYTFLSIGQFVNIFDTTFSLSISRNVTYAWSGMKRIKAEGFDSYEIEKGNSHNYRLLISIVRTCRVIFGLISLVAMGLLLTGGTVYIGYAARGLNKNIWLTAWVIYSVGVFLNLFYSYWLTSLRGIGAIKQAQISNVIAKLTQIILSIVGLYLGGGIIALSVAFFLCGLVMRVFSKRFFMNYEEVGEAYKNYKTQIDRREIRKNFRIIWFNAKKNGMNSIAAFGITQTTTIVCSGYLGLIETASYGLCQQIITAIAGVAMICFNTMKPKLTELKLGGEETKEGFIKCVSLSVLVYWAAFLIEMVILVTIGLPVIRLLKSDTDIPIIMATFMGLYLFLEYNHSIFCGIIEVSNRVPYARAGVISSACIIIGEFVAVRFLNANIYGLMFVQFVVQLAYNNWYWPRQIMKEYQLSILSIIRYGIREVNRTAKVFLKL